MHEVEVDLNNILKKPGLSNILIPILVQVLQDELIECFKPELFTWFESNDVKIIWRKNYALEAVYENAEIFDILKYTIIFEFEKEEDAILFKITWA